MLTITGTNLDLVTEVVFGGDVKGVISSFTATTLEVAVPLTATEGKVTLNTHSGKTAETEAKLKAVIQAEESLRRSQASEARDRFDNLLPAEQDELLAAFKETLKGPSLTSFRKSGLKTQLVSATFNNWLITTLLQASA